MKVLLVEDNERVAQFVLKGLAESGHTTDYAATGRDGMFLAASEPYDAHELRRSTRLLLRLEADSWHRDNSAA